MLIGTKTFDLAATFKEGLNSISNFNLFAKPVNDSSPTLSIKRSPIIIDLHRKLTNADFLAKRNTRGYKAITVNSEEYKFIESIIINAGDILENPLTELFNLGKKFIDGNNDIETLESLVEMSKFFIKNQTDCYKIAECIISIVRADHSTIQVERRKMLNGSSFGRKNMTNDVIEQINKRLLSNSDLLHNKLQETLSLKQREILLKKREILLKQHAMSLEMPDVQFSVSSDGPTIIATLQKPVIDQLAINNTTTDSQYNEFSAQLHNKLESVHTCEIAYNALLGFIKHYHITPDQFSRLLEVANKILNPNMNILSQENIKEELNIQIDSILNNRVLIYSNLAEQLLTVVLNKDRRLLNWLSDKNAPHYTESQNYRPPFHTTASNITEVPTTASKSNITEVPTTASKSNITGELLDHTIYAVGSLLSNVKQDLKQSANSISSTISMSLKSAASVQLEQDCHLLLTAIRKHAITIVDWDKLENIANMLCESKTSMPDIIKQYKLNDSKIKIIEALQRAIMNDTKKKILSQLQFACLPDHSTATYCDEIDERPKVIEWPTDIPDRADIRRADIRLEEINEKAQYQWSALPNQ